MGAEHSTGPQLVKVGETDSGECVEEVGLGGADAVRVLGASTKGAASCHTIIVRATPTALPSIRLGHGEVIRSSWAGADSTAVTTRTVHSRPGEGGCRRRRTDQWHGEG